LLAGTGEPFCSQTVTLKVVIVEWGEEVGWDINGEIEHPEYTNDNNGQLLQYRFNLSTSVVYHVLNTVDYYGDGWEGGYVQLLNFCGKTIAGGPLEGQVWGAGFSFPFATASLCCSCNDDPDGALIRAPQAGPPRGFLNQNPLDGLTRPLKESLHKLPLENCYANSPCFCGPPSHSAPATPRTQILMALGASQGSSFPSLDCSLALVIPRLSPFNH
jgi:hypothetical protein